ncbi:hypothetical protein Mapa_004550 [Marchantia paleacea]|nr:hypothetical protein Mapa_004550 [Marchantia paleacea]
MHLWRQGFSWPRGKRKMILTCGSKAFHLPTAPPARFLDMFGGRASEMVIHLHTSKQAVRIR